MNREIAIFNIEEGVDDFLVPEGGDDRGVGSEVLGEIPTEAGAEVVQQVGTRPEVYKFT